MYGGNTREFRVAQGMVEQSFDFDFTDLPLEWQGDLIEWANRTLRWRDQRDVTIVTDREVGILHSWRSPDSPWASDAGVS